MNVGTCVCVCVVRCFAKGRFRPVKEFGNQSGAVEFVRCGGIYYINGIKNCIVRLDTS